MKRTVFIGFAIVLLICAIFLFLSLNSPQSSPPQFKRSPTQAPIGNVSYDFLGARPFEGGRMVSYSYSGTNREVFVLDIENRRILGQLANGWPELLVSKPPQLLCSQVNPGPTAWQRKSRDFLKLMATLFGGRIKVRSLESETSTYWLLDLERNTATSLGNIPGTPNFIFAPSPDFNYAYTARNGQSWVLEYYLFDLRKRNITKLDTNAFACGWWDDSRILFETTNSAFFLHDVRKNATSPLISSEKLGAFLEGNNLTFGTWWSHAFAIWNGRENDFYLTDPHKNWLAEESFLIKVERPDGRLKLISPRFKSEWSDHLDPSGRLYLYSGREGGKGSDGVFLRHLDGGTNQVLVAPTTNNSHSIPRFYRDSVIYLRSNALWRINLNGSNNVKLFPPAR